MAIIKAPFNFIPLNNRVFYPNWADEVSHDIPFEDGVSGVIDVEFKAETPVFVRNASDSRDNKDVHSCRMPDGRFIIPGTTLKGCIRNVMTVMSFGKMRLDKSLRFAQREWDNKELYPLKKEAENLRCGWLKYEKERGKYVVEDCGEPCRIGMHELDIYLGKKIFELNFAKTSNVNLNEEQKIEGKLYDPKTAVYKYKLLEGYDLGYEIPLGFTCKNEKKRRVEIDEEGAIKGCIVLTGQPDKCEWPGISKSRKGKFYEFVFREDTQKRRIEIDEDVYRQYDLMYAESPDWNYWKKHSAGKGIPVFFRLDDKGGIKDFGLAFMYKLPYERTPYECLGVMYDAEKRDLADCVFGYTSDDRSLRGRVQFSAFFSENAEESGKVDLVLNSPKASYYPMYINQSGTGKVVKYKTYNDGQIAGYKRYVLRRKVWSKDTEGISEKMLSHLMALKAGAVFKGKIRFHNLKEVELGALLSALTFHGNAGVCCHQIGQGKPYGYGRMSLQNLQLTVTRGEGEEIGYYMAVFEQVMKGFYGGWLYSEQLRELLALCGNVIEEQESDKFKYMHHDNKSSEFVDVKKEKEALQRFSHLKGGGIIPHGLEEQYAERIAEKKRIREENQEREKKEAEERRLRLAKEEEERRRMEEERKRMEEERKRMEEEAKEQQRREEAKKRRQESGLVFLNEKNLQGKFKVNDFKGGFNRIEKWMKDVNTQRIELHTFKEDLEEWLERACREDRKKQEWENRQGRIWKSLEKLLSVEDVDELYKCVMQK